MGLTVVCRFYPKELTKLQYLLYLDYGECYGKSVEFNGKHMPEGFWEACREYGDAHMVPRCFVFTEHLTQFITKNCIPDELFELWTDSEDTEDALIIWLD
jgi:hypothetical protein